MRLRRLRVAKLPVGAIVRISCAGGRCPFKRRTVTKQKGTRLDLLGALGRAARRLRAGQTHKVLVTAHAYDGKPPLAATPGARAKRVTRCIPLGNTKPRPRC